MANLTLTASPALGGIELEIGQNRIAERSDLAIVSIATPLGGKDILAKTLNTGWSLTMPDPIMSTVEGNTRAIRTSPDQILLIFPHGTPDANATVQKKLNGTGYTTDQTDAWVILEISGPDTLKALERLCLLDTATFEIGQSARTMMEHMGALIIRLEDDRFMLMSASSSAGSFLHAVETSYNYVS